MKERPCQVPETSSTRHRGPDPRDAVAFDPRTLADLRAAVADLSWLLGHGYAVVSATKLVGDRWSLTERQRMALRRASCSDESRTRRRRREVAAADLAGRPILIDGFNVVTTIETALSGGVILHCRDGTYRDLAGVHGTYRSVTETLPGLGLIGETLGQLGISRGSWLFDRPVSNSGRVRGLVLETARAGGWDWTVELVNNPDAVLKESVDIVTSADSAILDRCGSWFNLARFVIETRCPDANVVNLAD
jgi:hypothetical protein